MSKDVKWQDYTANVPWNTHRASCSLVMKLESFLLVILQHVFVLCPLVLNVDQEVPDFKVLSIHIICFLMPPPPKNNSHCHSWVCFWIWPDWWCTGITSQWWLLLLCWDSMNNPTEVERGFLAYASISLGIIKGSQDRNLNRVRTRWQELMQRPQMGAEGCCLLTCSLGFSTCFL